MVFDQTGIQDIEAARPGFLFGIATLVTIPVALYVLSWALRGFPAKQAEPVGGIAALWAVIAIPLFVAAVIRRRRLAVFGEIDVTIEPYPVVSGREFSGFVSVDSGAKIVTKEVVLAQVTRRGDVMWESDDLSQGIDTSGYRQKVLFRGRVPADAKGSGWEIRTRIRTDRDRTRTYHSVPLESEGLS